MHKHQEESKKTKKKETINKLILIPDMRPTVSSIITVTHHSVKKHKRKRINYWQESGEYTVLHFDENTIEWLIAISK